VLLLSLALYDAMRRSGSFTNVDETVPLSSSTPPLAPSPPTPPCPLLGRLRLRFDDGNITLGGRAVAVGRVVEPRLVSPAELVAWLDDRANLQ